MPFLLQVCQARVLLALLVTFNGKLVVLYLQRHYDTQWSCENNHPASLQPNLIEIDYYRLYFFIHAFLIRSTFTCSLHWIMIERNLFYSPFSLKICFPFIGLFIRFHRSSQNPKLVWDVSFVLILVEILSSFVFFEHVLVIYLFVHLISSFIPETCLAFFFFVSILLEILWSSLSHSCRKLSNVYSLLYSW